MEVKKRFLSRIREIAIVVIALMSSFINFFEKDNNEWRQIINHMSCSPIVFQRKYITPECRQEFFGK